MTGTDKMECWFVRIGRTPLPYQHLGAVKRWGYPRYACVFYNGDAAFEHGAAGMG